MAMMTMNWLRNYANLHKMSSYMDKLTAIYEAPHSYYLLEWLFIPADEEMLASINFSRTPGLVRDSYLSFTKVLLTQLIYELAFSAYEQRRSHELMLQTAIYDLKAHHGAQRWQEAVQRWVQHLDTVFEKQAECEQLIKAKKQQLQQRYEDKILQLKLDLPPQSDVLHEQLFDAKAVHEQRVKEAVNKLVFQDYKAWPLIAYLHVQQTDEALVKLRWLASLSLREEEHTIIMQFRKQQFTQLVPMLQQDESLMQRFKQWVRAYAAKTLMTIEHVNIVNRQQCWLALLSYLDETAVEDESLVMLWDVTYTIDGISETMMDKGQVPSYMHRLVALALKQNRRIKWLREAVVLRYWEIFYTAFMDEFYDYKQTSWLLCLDPGSIEARFIRSQKQVGDGHDIDLAFVKERISQIFIDAVRSGIPLHMMAPLLKHLTVHHIDFIYSYIHNMKQADDFLPLLQMEAMWLQRVFAGQGIRASEARRAVLPIILTWLEDKVKSETEEVIWQQSRLIYESHKGELLQQWLARVAQRGSGWPAEEAQYLASWLNIRWLAPLADAKQTHEQITQWLSEHSDWVQFERDGQVEQQQGVTYTIVRPGYIDNETGQLLARVTIRAELTDPTLIASVLDDLKDL